MTRDINTDGYPINRRNVLKNITAAGVVGTLGIPSLSGSAFAEEHGIDTCRDIDIMCAIDTSGSLSGTESAELQAAVNAFIDALPTDGSALVGSMEFGNSGVRNKNDLQNPSGLTVSTASPGGNTPMPGALDIADQAVYGDPLARPAATKLVVLFTDGGPNYPSSGASFGVGGYSAPRDTTADWSAVAGNSVYDNGDTASATVSKGEMVETAVVASSIKSGSVGDGATLVATVFFSDEDTAAMTGPAITEYTNLPTYLAEHIATSANFAINTVDTDVLVDELTALLDELCEEECVTCEGDGQLVKYEYVYGDGDENLVDAFVLDGEGTESISYESYVSKAGEAGEPVSATFSTDYCDLYALVKAGQEFSVQQLTAEDGQVTVDYVAPHAISFVAFYCTEEAALAARDAFPSRGRGGGRPDPSPTPVSTSQSQGRGRSQNRGRGRGRGRGR